MKRMRVVLVSLFCIQLAGCIIPTTAGGFPVNGVVLDQCTGNPVEGVTVYLHYEALNAFSQANRTSAPVTTNAGGEFYIPAEEVVLLGGTGGLDGYSMKWPSVQYRKDG